MALAGIDVKYRREFVDHPVDLKKSNILDRKINVLKLDYIWKRL